mmetsp:Transcript_110892/g.313686  ORF Transcript_110892/g.313686 Transcript_110892/m.313686 type:complete len:211 (-) Transcript_110892:1028-1660(-)
MMRASPRSATCAACTLPPCTGTWRALALAPALAHGGGYCRTRCHPRRPLASGAGAGSASSWRACRGRRSRRTDLARSTGVRRHRYRPRSAKLRARASRSQPRPQRRCLRRCVRHWATQKSVRSSGCIGLSAPTSPGSISGSTSRTTLSSCVRLDPLGSRAPFAWLAPCRQTTRSGALWTSAGSMAVGQQRRQCSRSSTRSRRRACTQSFS